MALSAALHRRLCAFPLGLGGAPLGNLFHALDDAAARATLARAWQDGVRYFDTAPFYGFGLSERRVGDALRALGPRGDDEAPEAVSAKPSSPPKRGPDGNAWPSGNAEAATPVVSTKVGRILVPDGAAPRVQHGYVDTLPFVQRYDYSADGLRRSLDDSLQRMGRAAVDLVFVHDIERAVHGADYEARLAEVLDSGLPALAALKAQGRIGGYGLGVNDVAACLAVLDHADLDVILIAGRYTLADRSAAAELLPRCEARGVTLIAAGPFNSGILATGSAPRDGSVPMFDYRPATPEVLRRVQAIESLCAAHGVPLRAAALQFPLRHRAVGCVLAGARSPDEVADAVAMARHPVPPAFWDALAALDAGT